MRSIKGFTLIEVMIVVAIMAILALIAVTQYQTYLERSRNSAVQTLLHNLALAEMTLKTSPEQEEFLPIHDANANENIVRLGGFGFRPDPQVGFAAVAYGGEMAGGFVLFAAYCRVEAPIYVYNFVPRTGVRTFDPTASYAAVLPENLKAYRWKLDGSNYSTTEVAVLHLDPQGLVQSVAAP